MKRFFSLLHADSVHLEPGEKIVEAKDFTSLKKAADILKKVKSDEQKYRMEVAQEQEQLKQQAYNEGFEEGLKNLNHIFLEFNEILANFKEELNSQILPIALKAAKKILGDEIKLHPQRIVDIVMQALKPVTQHHKIKIFVNKEDLAHLEEEKDKIKQSLQNVDLFVLQERDDVEPGGCIIETEAGIINAQLQSQWRAIEAAFEKFTKK